jgi:hypothetical protein
MSSQKVPYWHLFEESVVLRYRNIPRRGRVRESMLDIVFFLYATVTVLGSAIRFMDWLSLSVMGDQLDATFMRIALSLVAGYVALVKNVWIFKVVMWWARHLSTLHTNTLRSQPVYIRRANTKSSALWRAFR